jgi:hypothetical protein
MSYSHLTQWIEEADARRFCEAASWQLMPAATENHGRHLGKRIHDVAAHALCAALHPLRSLHS